MQRRTFLQTGALVAQASWLAGCGGGGESVAPANTYKQTNLVANSAAYAPQILEPNLIDAWGIAIRPAGAGGHFWVTGMGTSFEYVGDVNGRPLVTDNLAEVALPASGGNGGAANGVVFNSGSNFVITQAHANGAITAPAKFIFVSDNGVLSAWTERSRPDGSFDRSADALTMVDYGDQGSAFFGLAINPAQDQLIVVDFGNNPAPTLRIFNSQFREEPLAGRFRNPFITTAAARPGDLVPFNAQTIRYAGNTSVFVAYVNSSAEAAVESSGRGRGRLVEYSVSGQYIATWDDRGVLNGPWGVVVAPANFGPFSNQLLVSNFSDGTIVGFDTGSKRATEYMRDTAGNVLKIQGLWNLLFGNGASLGDSNALYFAAGPADETDGLFGSLRHIG